MIPGVAKSSTPFWVNILESLFVEFIQSSLSLKEEGSTCLVFYLLNMNYSLVSCWIKHFFIFRQSSFFYQIILNYLN